MPCITTPLAKKTFQLVSKLETLEPFVAEDQIDPIIALARELLEHVSEFEGRIIDAVLATKEQRQPTTTVSVPEAQEGPPGFPS